MPTSTKMTNLIINNVDNQEIYNYMKANGLINENELYLVKGDDDVYATKSTKIDTTLIAANWNSNVYIFNHAAITATCVIDMLPQPTITADQFSALQSANIIGGVQVNGAIQLRAMGTAPYIDIPITFIARGDL